MAATTSPDDLDAILDDALDAFDAAQATTAAPRPPAAAVSSNGPATTAHPPAAPLADDPPDEPANAPPSAVAPVAVEEEAAAVPGLGGDDDDDAGRALEDALRALGELGLGADAADRDVSDADMKLVEEFVTSLGESLSGLGVPGAGDGDATGAATATGTGAGAGGANGAMPADGAHGGAQTRPEVERLVESIVGHLLSEDVLRAPMAQMRAAYADWLPANEAALSAQDRTRFTRQQKLVGQICDKYEARAPSPEIMELLAQMQETGAPPDEVMRQLSSDSAVDTLLKQLG